MDDCRDIRNVQEMCIGRRKWGTLRVILCCSRWSGSGWLVVVKCDHVKTARQQSFDHPPRSAGPPDALYRDFTNHCLSRRRHRKNLPAQSASPMTVLVQLSRLMTPLNSCPLLPRSNGPVGINAIICVDDAGGHESWVLLLQRAGQIIQPATCLHASTIYTTNLQLSNSAER